MTEDELIDDYVFGLLSSDDRAKFEQHFLSVPKRKEKLANSLALRQYAQAKVEVIPSLRTRNSRFYIRKRKLLLIPIAACLCLVLTVVVVKQHEAMRRLMLPNTASSGKKKQPVFGPDAQMSENKAAPLNAQRSESNAHKSSGMEAMLVLSPGLTRGLGAEARLRLPPDARFATFTLLASNAQEGKLKEELLTAQGVTIFSDEVSVTASQAKLGKLSLVVPVQFLHPDDYQIKLSQADSTEEWGTIATYTFRILQAR